MINAFNSSLPSGGGSWEGLELVEEARSLKVSLGEGAVWLVQSLLPE